MSNHSIPRTRKKRKSWRKHLTQQRQLSSYFADIEVVRLETRLQIRLSPQAWDEIQARWQALPDPNTCFPEQRRDFLLHEEMLHEETAMDLEHLAEVMV